MRSGDRCDCDEGWTGINCNVCTKNSACNALMETGSGGVCYTNGEVVEANNQICTVKNKQIQKLLGDQTAEVTFTCNKGDETCDFQCKFESVLRKPPSYIKFVKILANHTYNTC